MHPSSTLPAPACRARHGLLGLVLILWLGVTPGVIANDAPLHLVVQPHTAPTVATAAVGTIAPFALVGAAAPDNPAAPLGPGAAPAHLLLVGLMIGFGLLSLALGRPLR